MNVFDRVRRSDNSDITGVVVETNEITTRVANPDMETVSEETNIRVKVLEFPAMKVVSGNILDWQLLDI